MTEAALDYVAPVVDAFKFDLKAATAEGWARLTKVKDPAPAHAAAVRAKELHGCHVEVVSNIVPELNDDDASLSAMARWVHDELGPGTPWHLTRFMPEFELSYLSPTPIKTLERGVGLGKAAGLRFVYVGNVQGHAARHTICPGLRAHCHPEDRAEDRDLGDQAGAVRGLRRRPWARMVLGLRRRGLRSCLDACASRVASPRRNVRVSGGRARIYHRGEDDHSWQ